MEPLILYKSVPNYLYHSSASKQMKIRAFAASSSTQSTNQQLVGYAASQI